MASTTVRFRAAGVQPTSSSTIRARSRTWSARFVRFDVWARWHEPGEGDGASCSSPRLAAVYFAAAFPDAVLAGDARDYRGLMVEVFSGRLPYLDLPFPHLPLMLVPMAVAWADRRKPGPPVLCIRSGRGFDGDHRRNRSRLEADRDRRRHQGSDAQMDPAHRAVAAISAFSQ